MFLNTTLGTFVSPSLFPGRFLVCINTEDRKDCGLFLRRGMEMVRQPVIEYEEWSGEGLEVFEVSGLPQPRPDQSIHYDFVSISWTHYAYPSSHELVVVSSDVWHFSYRGVRVALDDFRGLPQ